jgi:hypothetical protein
VERHRRSPARKSRIAQPSAGNNSAVNLSLPHIADFIEDGQITLGQMDPIGCVAIANDGHNCLAMLARNDGETLAQLLARLDQAIARAIDEDIFTDEINS